MYWNEISILTGKCARALGSVRRMLTGVVAGYPLFLLSPPSRKPTFKATKGVRQRVSAWWNLVNDREARQKFLSKRPSRHIYDLHTWLELALWLINSGVK